MSSYSDLSGIRYQSSSGPDGWGIDVLIVFSGRRVVIYEGKRSTPFYGTE